MVSLEWFVGFGSYMDIQLDWHGQQVGSILNSFDWIYITISCDSCYVAGIWWRGARVVSFG
jgi:uncharacterized protein (DUF2461 family)